MTEEEIELWYEEEKQRLTERYIKSIDAGMSVEAREAKFNKAMDKLAKQYNAKHTALMRQRDNDAQRKKKKALILRPFYALGHVSMMLFKFIWGGINSLFRSQYKIFHFKVSMFWIHNGYKLTDGTRRMFRPLWIFYIKHLQETVIIIRTPFVRAYKHLSNKAANFKEKTTNTSKSALKATIKAAKWIWKKILAAHKWVGAKHEAWSKKYHEWVSKRVQAKLDRQQKKKEEKEQRRKEKEGVAEKKLKEGESAKHVGEAPDAENTS